MARLYPVDRDWPTREWTHLIKIQDDPSKVLSERKVIAGDKVLHRPERDMYVDETIPAGVDLLYEIVDDGGKIQQAYIFRVKTDWTTPSHQLDDRTLET